MCFMHKLQNAGGFAKANPKVAARGKRAEWAEGGHEAQSKATLAHANQAEGRGGPTTRVL